MSLRNLKLRLPKPLRGKAKRKTRLVLAKDGWVTLWRVKPNCTGTGIGFTSFSCQQVEILATLSDEGLLALQAAIHSLLSAESEDQKNRR